jgi:hypothetical protein
VPGELLLIFALLGPSRSERRGWQFLWLPYNIRPAASWIFYGPKSNTRYCFNGLPLAFRRELMTRNCNKINGLLDVITRAGVGLGFAVVQGHNFRGSDLPCKPKNRSGI